MQTSKFLTSIVAPDGAKIGNPVFYTEPIQSEFLCHLVPHPTGGNFAVFKNCHVTVYQSKNSELISKNDVLNGKHVVADDEKIYQLDVYLQIDDDNVMTNHINLSSYLPKGMEMNLMRKAGKINIFVFSDFSVILFDIRKDFSAEIIQQPKKYRLGNQPEEYELKEDYLGWIPENYEDWGELIFLNIKNQEIKIKNEKVSKTIFLHHCIAKDAFPLNFFGEERAKKLHLFAIVSETEESEQFIIPLH